MRGIIRPCRHNLGPELHRRWTAHLCGLCLSLRDTVGQSARVLAGYDVLLVSVLVEAQTGRLPTQNAGPCALRGFRTAQVVDATTAAMRESTVSALLMGSAVLQDKVEDHDFARWLHPVASRIADRLGLAAAAIPAGSTERAPRSAAGDARAAESSESPTLDHLLGAAGAAVGALFSHTADAAGAPDNATALREAGDRFGRLVHLADAGRDRGADRRRGRFNPLDATGTDDRCAGATARRLHRELLRALEAVRFVDGDLARALLGPTLRAAIERAWPIPRRDPAVRAHGSHLCECASAGMAMAATAHAATIAVSPLGSGRRGTWAGARTRAGGGTWGPYGGRPYGGGRYRGGVWRGPGCGQMLACDCCTSCCCQSCCGGSPCCCIC